jgi:hypothetical protein
MSLRKSLVKIIIAGLTLGLFFIISSGKHSVNPVVLSLNIGGDVLLDRGVKTLVDMAGLEVVMKGVAPLLTSSDYTLINLECPATEIDAPAKKRYVFRSDPALLTGMRAAGVTHAGLANNHAFDQGEAGFADTIKTFAKAGITGVGVVKGETTVARPKLIEKNGIKIAVFAANMIEVANRDKASIEAGPWEPSSEEIYSSVKSFHHDHPEIHAIIFLHWGNEYSLFPTDNQVAFAHNLIDAGADAVIGCHPHVVQSVEAYHRRPIVYSLGNLLFDQSLPETQKGLIVTLAFGMDSLETVSLHTIKQIGGTPHLDGEKRLEFKKDMIMLPSNIFQSSEKAVDRDSSLRSE